MAEHDQGIADVDRISAAKAGDTVWVYESQMSLHVEGKYVGRGVWRLFKIQEETRQSFVVSGTKFDRKTGRERSRGGYSSGNMIAGEIEKSDHLWRSDHAYRMVNSLHNADTQTLRKVAEIIGWEAP